MDIYPDKPSWEYRENIERNFLANRRFIDTIICIRIVTECHIFVKYASIRFRLRVGRFIWIKVSNNDEDSFLLLSIHVYACVQFSMRAFGTRIDRNADLNRLNYRDG